MAVYVRDTRLVPTEGAGEDGDVLPIHYAHTHVHASTSLIGKGFDPCALITGQGNERLSYLEEEGELGNLAQCAYNQIKPTAHHDYITWKQGLLNINPPPRTLHLRGVPRRETLINCSLRCHVFNQIAQLALGTRRHLNHIP